MKSKLIAYILIGLCSILSILLIILYTNTMEQNICDSKRKYILSYHLTTENAKIILYSSESSAVYAPTVVEVVKQELNMNEVVLGTCEVHNDGAILYPEHIQIKENQKIVIVTINTEKEEKWSFDLAQKNSN